MNKENLDRAIREIEGFSEIGNREKVTLQQKVVGFGEYIASIAESVPTKDRMGSIDSQGRFFQALHELLDLTEADLPHTSDILRKIIDLAGCEVGAEYNRYYDIEESPKGLIFKRRSI